MRIYEHFNGFYLYPEIKTTDLISPDSTFKALQYYILNIIFVDIIIVPSYLSTTGMSNKPLSRNTWKSQLLTSLIPTALNDVFMHTVHCI